MTIKHSLFLALLAMTLVACSDAKSPAPTAAKTAAPATAASAPVAPLAMTRAAPALPRVIDSFVVGEDAYVRSLALEAKRRALWVGSSVGVLEIDLDKQTPRHTYTRADGLANEYVFAIHVDKDGYKWFGTNAGGVARFRDGEWKVFFPMHGLADYWIYAFAEQADGKLWIGTWAGANLLDRDKLEFKTYYKELINEWVYAIGIDSRQRVWFGTEGGVSMFDGQQWKEWNHADGLGAANTSAQPHSTNTGLGTRTRHSLNVDEQGRETYNPNYVFSLVVDGDDSIWCGTWGGGVAHFDGQRWTNLTSADGLAGDIVYSMARGADGVLWFGTNHGLSRYDGKQWRNYTRASDGLLDDNVYAIALVPGGDIWIGTRRGVTRLALHP